MLLDNQGKYDEVIVSTQEMIKLIDEVSENNEFNFDRMCFLEYQGKALQSILKFNDSQLSLAKALEIAQDLKNKNHEVFCSTMSRHLNNL